MTNDVEVIERSNGSTYTKNKTILPLTDTEGAYIAGIIDGEGNIALSKKSNGVGNKRGVAFRPYVNVANTNLELIEWLSKTTGLGSTVVIKRTHENRKTAYRWCLWSQQARQVIMAVFPYLIVKRRQAKLLLEFFEIDKHQYGRSGIPDDEWNKQVTAYEQIKTLNKRGIK